MTMHKIVDVAALKTQHDELLRQMPEGANHVAEECPLCKGSIGDTTSASEGGVMSTFTEEELAAKVAEAVAPLQAKITELSASHEQAEVEAKIAEAITPLNEQIVELQSKLDAQVLETEAAKTELAEMVGFLETAKADEEAAKELASKREERIALVKEVASFPEDHITANADRWASMDEEAFKASLDEWKLISAAKGGSEGTTVTTQVPAETAMSGAAAGGSDQKTNLREVMEMSIRGIDPRRV